MAIIAGADTWSNVTDLSQFNGTWEFGYSVTRAAREYSGPVLAQESEYIWDAGAEAYFGTMQITFNRGLKITINASAKTRAESGYYWWIYSDGNIAAIWDDLRMFWEDHEAGLTYNDDNHSRGCNYNSQLWTLTSEEIAKNLPGFQLSKDKNKIKTSADFVREDMRGMEMTRK